MSTNELTEKLDITIKKVGRIVLLALDAGSKDTIGNLLEEYTNDFYEKIDKATTQAEAIKIFNPFVNSVLSIIETLGIPPERYKPMRKLILNELYNFLNAVLLKKYKQ